MEDYNNLIDELDKVLKKLSSITDLDSQIAFFQENSSIFIAILEIIFLYSS